MKTKTILITLLAFIGLSTANAQVGVGTTTPDASAILDVEATDKGFLPPRLTTVQRDAIASPAEGLTIFNTDVNCIQFYNNSYWIDLCEGGATPGPLSECATLGFVPPYLTTAETLVKDVTSITGKTWMDRNLGAATAARASADCFAYGNLYQWGRAGEGHENRNNTTLHNANTLGYATTAAPNPSDAWYGNFITATISPEDWLSAQNDNLWDGVNGVNNPCPTGYRLPTGPELDDEIPHFGTPNVVGAFNSTLQLSAGGYREANTGAISDIGTTGYYWASSSNVNGRSSHLDLTSSSAATSIDPRAMGFSVRCIKQ